MSAGLRWVASGAAAVTGVPVPRARRAGAPHTWRAKRKQTKSASQRAQLPQGPSVGHLRHPFADGRATRPDKRFEDQPAVKQPYGPARRDNDSVASAPLSIDAPFVLGLRSSHPNRKVS